MEIYKKGLFNKHKMVMFNIDPREINITLRCLPEGKYYFVDIEGKKVFYKSPESIIDEWVD